MKKIRGRKDFLSPPPYFIRIGRLPHQSRESHESHCQNARREQRDRHSLHAGRDVFQFEPFAESGKKHQRQRKADGRRGRENDGFAEIVFLLYQQDGDPQDGAVRRDQRQEDAERLVERRAYFFQDDLDHLYQRGDYQNKNDGLHILDAERDEHVVLDQVGDDRRNGHHERNGGAHAQRRADPVGYAQERADPEKLRQYDVVDEDRTDDNDEVFHDYFVLAVSFLKMAIR